jgi:tetratricopeptide (TPR) repeat protein
MEAHGQPRDVARALNNVANIVDMRGDAERALALHGRALAIRRQIGDHNGVGYSLGNMAALYIDQDDHRRAASLAAEAYVLAVEAGDRLASSTWQGILAEVAEMEGDYRRALALYAESLAVRRELGVRFAVLGALSNMIRTHWRLGEVAAAKPLLAEALALAGEIGASQAGALLNAARLIGSNDPARALRWLLAARAQPDFTPSARHAAEWDALEAAWRAQSTAIQEPSPLAEAMAEALAWAGGETNDTRSTS